MVDLNTCPPTPPAGERSKIKSFMGRTPGIGILKSKFMTVLGNSNELLNGISSKLTLNISSSDSDYCDDDEEDLPQFDETIDYTKIDFESRRVKARRAHEEIISGRYRHPNLAPRVTLEATRPVTALGKSRRSSSSSSSSSSNSSSLSSHSLAAANVLERRSHVSSTTRSNSTESRHSGGYGRPGRAIAGARRSELDIKKDLMKINDILNPNMNLNPQIDVQPPNNINEHTNADMWAGTVAGGGATTSANSMRLPVRSRTSNSSTLTSLRDDPDVQVSPSAESTEELNVKNFIRSESQNSVPSWASSMSLDCRIGEEPVKEFMKRFTEHIFTNAAHIGLELKSEFGAMARLEIGRQWFARFLLEQKTKAKRVDELAFHSLVQYFAIVLFECGEYEDYPPGAVIMNLCFVFYHDIEVPGCDPYRQYLFTFMRQQPMWHTLRFWNAAFFDAVQKERDHRLAARLKRAEKRKRSRKERHAVKKNEAVESIPDTPGVKENMRAEGEHDGSSSSSSNHGNAPVRSAKGRLSTTDREELERGARLLENNDIVFRQMGAFTCNMHSLGIPQDQCLEFFKKQTASFNLPKDKTKLIKDNIYRMYHETDSWGAKES